MNHYLLTLPRFYGPPVKVPNNEVIKITKRGLLPLTTKLFNTTRQGNILPQLKNSPLVLIGQLCDDDCFAIFDKQELNIFKNWRKILTDYWNYTNCLWDILLKQLIMQKSSILSQQANVIIRKDQTKLELASYLHGCAFSPTLLTFNFARRKNFLHSWQGIKELNFEKLLITPVATAKGYLF